VVATGVPVPALLDIMRNQLTTEAADALHYGATSQGIVDTAHCICIGSALDDLARTRGQLATPITFGLRIAQWAQPLIGLEGELDAWRGAVRTLLENLIVDAKSMCARATSDTSVLAEAAVFALPPKVGRIAAGRIVSQALTSGGPLRDALASHGDIDGNSALSDTVLTNPAARVATQFFAQRKSGKSRWLT
jgi:hypothetical protein